MFKVKIKNIYNYLQLHLPSFPHSLPFLAPFFPQFKENTYEGSRADYVTTELFDDEHYFLLEPIPNTASPDQLINDDNPIVSTCSLLHV